MYHSDEIKFSIASHSLKLFNLEERLGVTYPQLYGADKIVVIHDKLMLVLDMNVQSFVFWYKSNTVLLQKNTNEWTMMWEMPFT